MLKSKSCLVESVSVYESVSPICVHENFDMVLLQDNNDDDKKLTFDILS